MPSTKTTLLSVTPSLLKPEMEDRKRSLINDVEDLAPSRKRIKDENGSAMRMPEDKEKEIEEFQKDAMYRQMKEYKRQRSDLEKEIKEIQRKARYHNDHLRIVDGWFKQLLDEVRLAASQALPSPPPSANPDAGEELYQSALLFEDNALFEDHLKARSAGIKSAIAELFGRLPTAAPDVEELRRQLTQLLAKEKEHTVELRRTIDEKDSLYERLEQAMGRYMTAERKLDRAKSTQVMKLEKQAMMGGTADNVSPTTSKAPAPKGDHSEPNGEIENGVVNAETETARREAVVAAEKRKAQLAEIEAENDRLTNELSAARTKLASLTDDDYAETALFKTLRAKYEDVMKRANDLEAMNGRLSQEAQKLHAERISYQNQTSSESTAAMSDAEQAAARADVDVSRLRDHRDQISAELAIAKSNKDSHAVSLEQAKELAEAHNLRIGALESEVERLKLAVAEAAAKPGDFEDLDRDTLLDKLRTRENQYHLLSNELPSIEAAWKKTQALASRKVTELAAFEEQMARLNAEKAKADQKYFAAMKSKDLREAELKTLKSQAARSSEIVSQLKDGEMKARELLVNLERQLADSKESFTKLELQYRGLEQKFREANIAVEGSKKNVEDLKTQVSLKDKENLSMAKTHRETQVELEKVKVRLEETEKKCDAMRKSRATTSSTDSDEWRTVVICPACNVRMRNTVLKLCGHVFCSQCVHELISNRSRKCPSCGRGFGTNDQMGIVLT